MWWLKSVMSRINHDEKAQRRHVLHREFELIWVSELLSDPIGDSALLVSASPWPLNVD